MGRTQRKRRSSHSITTTIEHVLWVTNSIHYPFNNAPSKLKYHSEWAQHLDHLWGSEVKSIVATEQWGNDCGVGDNGCMLRFMHEFGLMVSTQSVRMASHTVSALWERWFNYRKGSRSSATHVRHQTDSYLRGSLVKEICTQLSWGCSGMEHMHVGGVQLLWSWASFPLRPTLI